MLESQVTNPDLSNPTVLYTPTSFYPRSGQNSFGSHGGRLGQRGVDRFHSNKGRPSGLGSGYGSNSGLGRGTYGRSGGPRGSSGGSCRTCTVWYNNSNALQMLQWPVKMKIVVPDISIFLGRRSIIATKSVFGSILLSNQPTNQGGLTCPNEAPFAPPTSEEGSGGVGSRHRGDL